MNYRLTNVIPRQLLASASITEPPPMEHGDIIEQA